MRLIVHEEEQGKFKVIGEEEVDNLEWTLLTCHYPGREIIDVHVKPEMVCVYGVVLQLALLPKYMPFRPLGALNSGRKIRNQESSDGRR